MYDKGQLNDIDMESGNAVLNATERVSRKYFRSEAGDAMVPMRILTRFGKESPGILLRITRVSSGRFLSLMINSRTCDSEGSVSAARNPRK